MSTNEEVLDANIAQAIRECAAAIGKAVNDGRRTCVQCIRFDQRTEQCALAGQRPPAQVIAFGCDSFEEDIPF